MLETLIAVSLLSVVMVTVTSQSIKEYKMLNSKVASIKQSMNVRDKLLSSYDNYNLADDENLDKLIEEYNESLNKVDGAGLLSVQ